jgi:hypothetical protein
MPKLTATKSFGYATRRLRAGDEFVTSNRDARLLIAIGKAKPGEGVVVAPPKKAPRKAAPKKKHDPLDHDRDDKKGGAVTSEVLTKLRTDYLEAVGKKPFNGWDAVELQKRIDEALAS